MINILDKIFTMGYTVIVTRDTDVLLIGDIMVVTHVAVVVTQDFMVKGRKKFQCTDCDPTFLPHAVLLNCLEVKRFI